MQNRISREELVRIYNIEITFFDSLEEAGLVETELEDEVKYLRYEDLGHFEKFANWFEVTICEPMFERSVQNIDDDEANFLNIINKLKAVSGKTTVTKGNDKFVFKDSKLVSIESKEYKADFSGYTGSGSNEYPTVVKISENGKTKITYNLSNFK